MAFSYSHYLKEMRDALGCPVSWNKYDADPELKRVLFFYWAEVCGRHDAHGENRYYSQWDCIYSADPELLKRIQINSDIWKKEATKEYLRKTRFFSDYRHLSELEHDKHWTTKKRNNDVIIASTKDGPAKFIYRYPMIFLERALSASIRFNWRRIAEDQIPHLYVEFKRVIGGSLGKPAEYARFDLDYSNAHVHSHPILPEEKPSEEPWLTDLSDDNLWPDLFKLHTDATLDEPLEWDFPENES